MDQDNIGSNAIEKFEGLTCVWAGDLTQDELDAYIGVQEDAEGTPYIPFGRDLGAFADHDYLAVRATAEPESLPDLLARMGFDHEREFFDAVRRDVNPSNQFRCVIVYLNVAPTPDIYRRRFAAGKLRFIGCWPSE